MKRARERDDREKTYHAKEYISDVKRHVHESKNRGDMTEHVRLISKTEEGHVSRERLRDAMADAVYCDQNNDILSTDEFFGLVRDVSSLIESISNAGMDQILQRYTAHILQRVYKMVDEFKNESNVHNYLRLSKYFQSAMMFLLSSGQAKTDTGKVLLRFIDMFYIEGVPLNIRFGDKDSGWKLLLTLAKSIEYHAAIHTQGDNTLALKAMIRVCEELCEYFKSYWGLSHFSHNPELVRWLMKFEQAIIYHNSKHFHEWNKIKIPRALNSLVQQTADILANEVHPIEMQSRSQSQVEFQLKKYCAVLNRGRLNLVQAQVQREVLIAGYSVDMTLSLGRYICIIEVEGPQHYNTNGELRPLDIYREDVIREKLRTHDRDVHFIHIKSKDIGRFVFGESNVEDSFDEQIFYIDPMKYYRGSGQTTEKKSPPKSMTTYKSKLFDREHQGTKKPGMLRDETLFKGKRERADEQPTTDPGQSKRKY